MTTQFQSQKKRSVVLLAVFSVGFIGILYFHYRDMVKPIPYFDSLQQIPAEGMGHTLTKAPRLSQYSFEFTDQNGRRYQTRYMEAEEARAIEDALHRGPVILSVGRWQSALESDTIFTVYHMTSGDRVLINYADIAATKKKEQQGAIPVVVVSFFVIFGIVAYLHRKQQKS